MLGTGGTADRFGGTGADRGRPPIDVRGAGRREGSGPLLEGGLSPVVSMSEARRIERRMLLLLMAAEVECGRWWKDRLDASDSEEE